MNTIYHTVIVGLAIYYAIITMGALIGAIGALITIAILRRRQKRLSNPLIAEATKAL